MTSEIFCLHEQLPIVSVCTIIQWLIQAAELKIEVSLFWSFLWTDFGLQDFIFVLLLFFVILDRPCLDDYAPGQLSILFHH